MLSGVTASSIGHASFAIKHKGNEMSLPLFASLFPYQNDFLWTVRARLAFRQTPHSGNRRFELFARLQNIED